MPDSLLGGNIDRQCPCAFSAQESKPGLQVLPRLHTHPPGPCIEQIALLCGSRIRFPSWTQIPPHLFNQLCCRLNKNCIDELQVLYTFCYSWQEIPLQKQNPKPFLVLLFVSWKLPCKHKVQSLVKFSFKM